MSDISNKRDYDNISLATAPQQISGRNYKNKKNFSKSFSFGVGSAIPEWQRVNKNAATALPDLS